MPPRIRWLLAALAATLLAVPALAQDGTLVGGTQRHPLAPPDTSSPRATYKSFLSEANAAWKIYLSSGGTGGRGSDEEARRHVRRAARCLDLSEVPPALAEQTRLRSVVLLLDVFNRIQMPDPGAVPSADQVQAEALTRWTLPHTRIGIARIEDGPRAGEWLFTPQTVERAGEFYRRTRHLPLKPGAVIEDGYELFVTLPGWMIPLAWIEALPEWAQEVYLEQTLWQWALAVLVIGAAIWLGLLGIRWSRGGLDARPSRRRALAGPATVMLLGPVLNYLLSEQLGLTGTPSLLIQTLLEMLFFGAAAWAVMLIGGIVSNMMVASPRIQPGSIDENVVRLASRIVSLALAVFVLVEGARALGVPVFGVIAGLGVGGLAVALAAQSTLENFIGSLTLFADRPVRVGDFCRFGDKVGTVEEIGMRSTRIRTLARSVLTVPNAEFSRLQLDNLTLRDRILFRTTLSLRLETSPDQLRFVLARLRELLIAHPRVDDDPARVRLVKMGPSALVVEVFAYVCTGNWNEFLGIREDLFLRMLEVVEQSGTVLAPPARTSYVTAGAALDEERSRDAEAQVEQWRREAELPFPEFSTRKRGKLHDTLEYPPLGSPSPKSHRSTEDTDD